MKKIGIVVDDYKIERFQKALTEAGLAHSTYPLSGALKNHTVFHILVTPDEFEERVGQVHGICKKLEIDIHRSN